MCRHYEWKIKPQIIYTKLQSPAENMTPALSFICPAIHKGGPLASTVLCTFTVHVYTANYTSNSPVAPSVFILNRYTVLYYFTDLTAYFA